MARVAQGGSIVLSVSNFCRRNARAGFSPVGWTDDALDWYGDVPAARNWGRRPVGTLDIKPLMGVVLGSHSRKDMLFSCVEGIHANGVDVSREVPVIDGGPTDAAAMPFRNVPVEEYFQARRTIRDTLFVNHGFHRMDARRAPGGFEEDLHERSTSVGDD